MSNALTEAQKAYIIAHKDERPRSAVAKAAGVSMSAVYRIVRQCGGKLMYDRAKRNPEWERIVREHYATMAGHEIERQFGITEGRANKIAHDLGLTHDAATYARLRRESAERMRKYRDKIDQEAKTRKWKRRRRLDELRVWEGRPQQTHHRFAETPKRTYKAKWHLMHNYGYLAVEGEPYMLAYTERTRRMNEQRYGRKYGLEFKKAPSNSPNVGENRKNAGDPTRPPYMGRSGENEK